MTTVSEILKRKGSEVVSMGTKDSVLKAARLMNEHGIGGVVVIDQGNMVGIFTERDILRRVVVEERDPATTSLEDVMTTPVASCRPETDLEECVRAMTGKHIRHLPVVDGDRVCGIVTSGDILAFQVREHEDTIQYLNSYIFDLR
jgi:CBS domain-containing protein